MRLLVLGGTLFLGRHVVEAALAAGHRVTLFNRGETDPELFPEAEHLRGDRAGDLGALEAASWDAVLDTSGYFPRDARASAGLLSTRAERYAFVSSVSAYADLGGRVAEDDATAELADSGSIDPGRDYGALKAACEREVRAAFGERALVIRPGLIVGPHDPTGRFTYWVERLARGGDVLAPGDPDRRVQLIDARDLAEWMLRALTDGLAGTFNATGPDPRPAMAEVLEACRRAAGAEARLEWVDDEFLLERGVAEWQELPLWLVDPAWRGMLDADVSRAVAAGLTFRPLEETARATLCWLGAEGRPVRRRAGPVPLEDKALDPARELELLAEWRRAA